MNLHFLFAPQSVLTTTHPETRPKNAFGNTGPKKSFERMHTNFWRQEHVKS